MDTLRIRLFGRLELELGDRALPAFPTRAARSLFCYLVLHRHRLVPRPVLLGRLWPDRDEAGARGNLRTSLWRIRRIIEPDRAAAGAYLRVESDCIGFAPRAPYRLDVEDFEAGLAGIDRRLARGEPAGRGVLEAVLAGYRDDLLDDVYDDWCTFDRERLRLAFLTTLERLAFDHAERSQWTEAITAGLTLLHHDPLREHVHRLVMRCHWRAGNRPAALLQYEACARLLRAELGIAPMPETSALRAAVLRGGDARDDGRERPSSDGNGAAASVVRELDAAAAHLERARARAARALGADSHA